MPKFELNEDRKREIIGFKALTQDRTPWGQSDPYAPYDGWINHDRDIAIEWKFKNINFADIDSVFMDEAKLVGLRASKVRFKKVLYFAVCNGMAYYLEIDDIKGEPPREMFCRKDRLHLSGNYSRMVCKIDKKLFKKWKFIKGVKKNAQRKMVIR